MRTRRRERTHAQPSERVFGAAICTVVTAKNIGNRWSISVFYIDLFRTLAYAFRFEKLSGFLRTVSPGKNYKLICVTLDLIRRVGRKQSYSSDLLRLWNNDLRTKSRPVETKCSSSVREQLIRNTCDAWGWECLLLNRIVKRSRYANRAEEYCFKRTLCHCVILTTTNSLKK